MSRSTASVVANISSSDSLASLRRLLWNSSLIEISSSFISLTAFSSSLIISSRLSSSGNVILKTANAAFKSESSSSGDYVRMYAGSGTGKWDIYGSGQYLRFSDNDSAGSVRIDTRLGTGTAAAHAQLVSYISATGAIPTTGLIQTNNDNHALQLWNGNNSATYCGLMLETRTSGASGWSWPGPWTRQSTTSRTIASAVAARREAPGPEQSWGGPGPGWRGCRAELVD